MLMSSLYLRQNGPVLPPIPLLFVYEICLFQQGGYRMQRFISRCKGKTGMQVSALIEC